MKCTGPSERQYDLDDLGDLDCDVTFTVHSHSPDEEEVVVPMRDILFLADLHFQAVRKIERGGPAS